MTNPRENPQELTAVDATPIEIEIKRATVEECRKKVNEAEILQEKADKKWWRANNLVEHANIDVEFSHAQLCLSQRYGMDVEKNRKAYEEYLENSKGLVNLFEKADTELCEAKTELKNARASLEAAELDLKKAQREAVKN